MDIAAYCAGLRAIAAPGGVGFVVVTSRCHGTIPIAFEEITSRPNDAELMAYIQERCK